MSLFLTRRGARLATAAIGMIAVLTALQFAPSVLAQNGGSCCVPGNVEAGDTCYVGFESEEQCQEFGLNEYGQDDVIYDDESWFRCNTACGQNTNFFRCQNRDEVARGVNAPICIQAQADGIEHGYVYKTSCESACWWNSCETCEECNYSNLYNEPCTKLACEVNPTCVATQLPWGEEVFIESAGRTIYNQFSCAPKAETSCRASSQASSAPVDYQFEACCVKPPNNPGGPGITYIAATDNDTTNLEAVFGSEDVRALNYFLSYPVQCGEVYPPYKRVWNDMTPTPQALLNQFVIPICRGTQGASSTSSAAYQFEACCVRPPNNPDAPGMTYIAATDNDTATLQTVFGGVDVEALNYFLSYPVQCGGVQAPNSRVWTDMTPTRQVFYDTFVDPICRESQTSKVLTCCHPDTSTVLIGTDAGGICAPCVDGNCGLSACLPKPDDDTTYCGLQNEFTQCFSHSQCQSNLCGREGLCQSCQSDDWCDSRQCNEGLGICEGIADGGACIFDDQCVSYSCLKDSPDDVAGICGRLDNGERCKFNDQCGSRHCMLNDPGMLANAYGDLPVVIEDYGIVQSCSYQPAAAFRTFENAMPTRQFVQNLVKGCYENDGGSTSSDDYVYIDPKGKWPFTTPDPLNVSFYPSSVEPNETVFCDRRVGPLGAAVTALMSITGDMCQPYIKEQHERDLDYYTLFMDDASVLCSDVCPKVRRLSICVSENECTVMDTELCAVRGDYPLGFPATQGAGFDELTPDAAGNTGLDKYAFFKCYQARHDLFGLGCDVLKNYTIDGQPVVPPDCV